MMNTSRTQLHPSESRRPVQGGRGAASEYRSEQQTERSFLPVGAPGAPDTALEHLLHKAADAAN